MNLIPTLTLTKSLTKAYSDAEALTLIVMRKDSFFADISPAVISPWEHFYIMLGNSESAFENTSI